MGGAPTLGVAVLRFLVCYGLILINISTQGFPKLWVSWFGRVAVRGFPFGGSGVLAVAVCAAAAVGVGWIGGRGVCVLIRHTLTNCLCHCCHIT